MEIIMPSSGSGYFNNSNHLQDSTNSEANSNYDLNNYSSFNTFSYPTSNFQSINNNSNILNNEQSSTPAHSSIDQQSRSDPSSFRSINAQNNRFIKQEADQSSNSNFTSSTQYNQPRSGPITQSQLDYASMNNFQFPSNQHLFRSEHQPPVPQQQYQPHYQQAEPLRSPLPPTQYSQITTPNNVIPQSNFNSHFQYSSNFSHHEHRPSDQSPIYSQDYQQQQNSYFPQVVSRDEQQRQVAFNDPFNSRHHQHHQHQPAIQKVETFSNDDIQILKSLLFNGEKVKWKYVASKLANVSGRRATSTACCKKTRELFRLPSERACGDLGTSLPYVVHDSWKSIEQRR
ncbi:hypothetical protein BN7_1343 [Wickerhamomyces ciferrii]|uniref:Myb-like domain-containing protein n=1 Tax=Wickerhamomyces ciferrii (strain ATCC 14091 / BCRC 22168 / CBS 111 / JCM 3599 / NBRC 0793 / NRRL Y-1031 F-60-10) TaxID=1206466 RepID=K0KK21_WICCF|nr:uncharacterized protein BN7_1343 [Wickerhamomyces ciferrii]CCH41804.1 hypothetical protein BN7_1343 [Wickerhamomyces ciferrii]